VQHQGRGDHGRLRDVLELWLQQVRVSLNITRQIFLYAAFLMSMGNAAYVPPQSSPSPDAVVCADGKAVAEAAILACTRLIESPRYNEAGYVVWVTNRGLHEQRAGLYIQAIKDFSEAIRLKPDDVNLYLSRGATYGMSEKLDGAIADFDRALELDPDSGIAYMNRATARNRKGDHVGSLADYNRAINLIPENWMAWDGRCWVRAIIGKTLEGALADCAKALELHPGTANTMNTRGFVLYKQGRFEDAIASYDASIALDPNVASSYYMRGFARSKLHQDASGDLVKALQLEPGIRERYADYGIDPPKP
jgi:tetratricopeptide (TPR) repeat protein